MEKATSPSNEPRVPEYQRRFIDMFDTFMEQCFRFIEIQRVPPMSEEERIAKIRAIASEIGEKEQELVQLEAERRALSMISSSPQKIAGTSQNRSSSYKCEPDCSADCNANESK